MFLELHAEASGLGLFFFCVFRRCLRMFATGRVMFVKLLGAIRPVEIVALARNSKQGNGHKQEGEKFHRAASIATRRRNATPKEQEIHEDRSHPATAWAARS